jgi:hypothetical protein
MLAASRGWSGLELIDLRAKHRVAPESLVDGLQQGQLRPLGRGQIDGELGCLCFRADLHLGTVVRPACCGAATL